MDYNSVLRKTYRAYNVEIIHTQLVVLKFAESIKIPKVSNPKGFTLFLFNMSTLRPRPALSSSTAKAPVLKTELQPGSMSLPIFR